MVEKKATTPSASTRKTTASEPAADPINSRSWFPLEHLNSLFLASSGIFVAIMYFAGAQFQNSKAKALGMAGDLGSSSVQSLVATGVAVFINPYVFGLLTLLGVVAIAIYQGSDWLMFNERSPFRINKLRELSDTVGSEADQVKHITRKLAAMADDEIDEAEVISLERQFDALDRKVDRLNLRLRAAGMIKPLSDNLVIFCVSGLAAVMIFAGKVVGALEGESILSNVEGACAGCLTYKAGNRLAFGIASLQSDKVVMIATEDGLVGFELEEPFEIVRRPSDGNPAQDSKLPPSVQATARQAGDPTPSAAALKDPRS